MAQKILRHFYDRFRVENGFFYSFNVQIEAPDAALIAAGRSNAGLGVAVPPAPTFGQGGLNMEQTATDNTMENAAVSGMNVIGKDVFLSPKEAARARKRSIRIASKLRRQMLRGLNRQLFLIKRDKFIYRLRRLLAVRFALSYSAFSALNCRSCFLTSSLA